MFALLYGAVGLILVPVSVFALLQQPDVTWRSALPIAALLSVLFPVSHMILGWIVGVLGAAIYNLVTRWGGGIEVELD